MKRTLFFLFLTVSLTAAAPCFADEDSSYTQIRQWVQQLGNDSFLVRQRAEALLIRTGIQAYPELQRAKQSPDIEVVRRAEYILSQIEQSLLSMEHGEAAHFIHFYMFYADPANKARIIWALADPYLDLTKGEGLQTLCRLVRFEANNTLRLEAAKSLIASPPLLPSFRQKWYQDIRDSIRETGDDALLQCVVRYAVLWCDLDEAAEKAAPAATPEFQNRVRQVSTETLQLLERPENQIQSGSKIEILLHYAVADLQDAAGLIEERNKTVATALAIEPGPNPIIDSVIQVGLQDDLPMNEHYYTGVYLMGRYRLHWAIAHFQKVTADGHVALRFFANHRGADAALLLADYPLAIAFLDKQIALLRGPGHERNDAELAIAQAQRQQAYCQAEQAAAAEKWQEVQEAVERAWSIPLPQPESRDDGMDIDLMIVAHRLCKQQPDIDGEFKEKMDRQLKKAWSTMLSEYENDAAHSPQRGLVHACNGAAWLLANTDGDYQSALTLVEAALKIEPDNLSVLDTLANVYFLGGEAEKAIRVQERVVRFAPDAVVFQRALERFKRQ